MTELSDDISENFDRFIVEVIENGCLWGLEGPEGWALCASEKYSDSDVMPIWCQREFSERHCREEWSEYKPVAIDLEEFLDDWLPGMHDDVLLVGVNWDENLEGDETEPLDLLEEFEQELAP
jgi:hypothetical protein